jgi:uncharacterized membrane protein YeiH
LFPAPIAETYVVQRERCRDDRDTGRRGVETGLSGGLLRDVLLQDGVPASIANPWNPVAAFAAGAVLCFASPHGAVWRILAPVAEAATIAAWAVTGTAKAATLGIAPFSAVLLGVVSSVGGGAVRDVVVLRRVPEVFGGNTLTATCAAASAVIMIIAARLHCPEAGLAGGAATGGVLYLLARWRHWVLPPTARLRAGTPSEAPAASTESARPAPNLNTPTQLREG